MAINTNKSGPGLYDPAFEHDSCGVAFVVDIRGRRSRQIVEYAITALNNLAHRGASGSEVNTGDGAGILINMPDKFFRKTCPQDHISLPDPGRYGAGMVFLPSDPLQANQCEEMFESVINEEGCTLLGWREVPVDLSPVGATTLSVVPRFRQVFIGGFSATADRMDIERKLYVIRKRIEHAVTKSDLAERFYFHIPSLSAQTLIYKGMLTTDQVAVVFKDLQDTDLESALALVHSRFSTNTFPSWPLAHPYRYMCHNGEINTLRGNINWMHAREIICKSDLLPDLKRILPIVIEGGSDSATFDNVLEFLYMAGRELPHAVLMMIPEPWSGHESMDEERKAFYQFHGCIMEPWDGPASIAFTDGTVAGAVLDRNGLRPSRYYVTKDELVVMASEVGVIDIPPENVLVKERLHPGRIFLVDTSEGRIIGDEEIKRRYSSAQPYAKWLRDNLVHIDSLQESPNVPEPDHKFVLQRQRVFGYTEEDISFFLGPMAEQGQDPVGSMGTDAALAVLSDRSRLLYDYFKQLFAQVTNPPLDCIREELITQISVTIGPQGNLLNPLPESCRQIMLESSILDNKQMAKLNHLNHPFFKSITVPMLFETARGADGLRDALKEVCKKASEAVKEGYNIIILSDRAASKEMTPIPALLATAGVHHYLVREGSRTQTGLVVETGEARQVHHMCLLIGYGAGAINPYLAIESLDDMLRRGVLLDLSHETAVKQYIKGLNKGMLKVISKMGISTIQSYTGAQVFEAVGLDKDFVDEYFTWTSSRIEGIGLEVVAEEALMRSRSAFPERPSGKLTIDGGGEFQWRRDGEYHLLNPETVFGLQQSTEAGRYDLFKKYSEKIDNQSQKLATLRGLFDFKWAEEPIPLEEVEPAEEIFKRFSTGAMSYGSISQEAHETLAIAMNRIGGKSNTGEGGEDPERYYPDKNGDLRRSSIKQVASGRFGVTSEYLVNADDLQIKMAQGAKPGEGGQLPGSKVFPWIAKTRHSTPGVGLISPPPHHDIYSIEDLAQLIYDLKNSNPEARIHVKLVSEVGVGTVAAGVAKAHSDVVLISGHDGGTGASPITSIKHAGSPWELGLAETQQVLVMNRLRDRIVVQTDGQMKTGRDVVIGALLGADEYGFATAPLVVMGCIMMRVCHLNTCPVGIATQSPELRKKFTGTPESVVNFFCFIAEEVREYMARLGFRTMDEMIGQVDRLNIRKAVDHWKARGLNLAPIFHKPDMGPDVPLRNVCGQDHGLEKTLDRTTLVPLCKDAIENSNPIELDLPICNGNRTVGTILGYELTKKHGGNGLPDDTIRISFTGSAGQSFGAFIPKGISMILEGDSNDYVGKGLSGGKLVVFPAKESTFEPSENIIIGNVALYGATSGEAYFRGIAGERFCVRNSGAKAVVESVGDHGCEYMTGGRVVVLGNTGRNFAAGMSGGIAYILDEKCDFETKLNPEMVDLEELKELEDIEEVRLLIQNHFSYTRSTIAENILSNWKLYRSKFRKVMPKDFKRATMAIKRAKEQGLNWEEAVMEGAHG